jgi:hypothetical protein
MITNKEQLKDRYEVTKKNLEAKYASLKAETRAGAAREMEDIKARMDSLQDSIKSGWENLTEEASAHINKLLHRLESQDKQEDNKLSQ